MTKTAALYSFFSSFGLTAYANTNVPTDAEFPYLTYTNVVDSWGNSVSLTINLWYLTESEAIPNAKVQEISEKISGGYYVACDGGALLITRGSPFAQAVVEESNLNIKRRYLNINVEYLTLN